MAATVCRIVLMLSIAMVVSGAASAELGVEWVKTEIGQHFELTDLNSHGQGVGTTGGRNHRHAVVWDRPSTS